MSGPFTYAGVHDPPTYEVVIRAVVPYSQTDPVTWDSQVLLDHVMQLIDVEVESFVLVRRKASIPAPEAVHSARKPVEQPGTGDKP